MFTFTPFVIYCFDYSFPIKKSIDTWLDDLFKYFLKNLK